MYGEGNRMNGNSLHLEFTGLTATVTKTQAARTVILPGIKGMLDVSPGSMSAVMGRSGSGKTTFLNAVAGRRAGQGLNVSGDIQVVKADGTALCAISEYKTSFVTQEPIVLPSLTCRETFAFALAMYHSELSEELRAERCEKLLADLGLTSCADTRIGDAIARGISGGQKKRVSIGAQLVTNPKVLFLDEPCSGLDSFVSQQLCVLLRTVARKNEMAVVLTIHQPSYTIYELLTHVMVFLSTGNVAYSGLRSRLTTYFTRLLKPVLRHIDFRRTNPADHALEVLSNLTAEQRRAVVEIYQTTLEQVEGKQQRRQAWAEDAVPAEVASSPHNQEFRNEPHVAPPLGMQMKLLAQRSWYIFARLPWMLMAKCLHFLCIGLFVGVAFWDLADSQESVQNRLGALYFTSIVQVFGGALSVVLTFAPERSVFLLEQETSMYSAAAYYMAKQLVDVPLFAVGTFISSLLIYVMTGLAWSFVQFFNYQVVILLLSLSGQAIGLIVAAAAGTVEKATLFTPLVISPSILITSYAFPYGDIPLYFEWLKFLSPFYFAFDALALNEFVVKKLNLSCRDDQLILIPYQPHSSSVSTQRSLLSEAYVLPCKWSTGVEVLESYGIGQQHSFGFCVLMLFLLNLLFRVTGFLVLKYQAHKAVSQG